MTAVIESLEVRIERAWDALIDQVPGDTLTVHINRSGLLIVALDRCAFPGQAIVGRYNREIDLADFRADVFCAFEQIRGRG